MNVLASFGLARWGGGLRFELTPAGEKLAEENDKRKEDHGEIEMQIREILEKQ